MKQISILLILVLMIGCAPHYRSSGYNPDDVGKPISITKGEVENVRPAQIDQGDSGFGGMAGAYAGGVAGSAVGGGKGQVLATILGVVIGAVAGTAAEKAGNKRQAEEITVRLDDGRTFAVVQEIGTEKLQAGDRVEVLRSSDNKMRVRRAPDNAPPAPAKAERPIDPKDEPRMAPMKPNEPTPPPPVDNENED
jgi:outer membrane lipoprotein SlyB